METLLRNGEQAQKIRGAEHTDRSQSVIGSRMAECRPLLLEDKEAGPSFPSAAAAATLAEALIQPQVSYHGVQRDCSSPFSPDDYGQSHLVPYEDLQQALQQAYRKNWEHPQRPCESQSSCFPFSVFDEDRLTASPLEQSSMQARYDGVERLVPTNTSLRSPRSRHRPSKIVKSSTLPGVRSGSLQQKSMSRRKTRIMTDPTPTPSRAQALQRSAYGGVGPRPCLASGEPRSSSVGSAREKHDVNKDTILVSLLAKPLPSSRLSEDDINDPLALFGPVIRLGRNVENRALPPLVTRECTITSVSRNGDRIYSSTHSPFSPTSVARRELKRKEALEKLTGYAGISVSSTSCTPTDNATATRQHRTLGQEESWGATTIVTKKQVSSQTSRKTTPVCPYPITPPPSTVLSSYLCPPQLPLAPRLTSLPPTLQIRASTSSFSAESLLTLAAGTAARQNRLSNRTLEALFLTASVASSSASPMSVSIPRSLSQHNTRQPLLSMAPAGPDANMTSNMTAAKSVPGMRVQDRPPGARRRSQRLLPKTTPEVGSAADVPSPIPAVIPPTSAPTTAKIPTTSPSRKQLPPSPPPPSPKKSSAITLVRDSPGPLTTPNSSNQLLEFPDLVSSTPPREDQSKIQSPSQPKIQTFEHPDLVPRSLSFVASASSSPSTSSSLPEPESQSQPPYSLNEISLTSFPPYRPNRHSLAQSLAVLLPAVVSNAIEEILGSWSSRNSRSSRRLEPDDGVLSIYDASGSETPKAAERERGIVSRKNVSSSDHESLNSITALTTLSNLSCKPSRRHHRRGRRRNDHRNRSIQARKEAQPHLPHSPSPSRPTSTSTVVTTSFMPPDSTTAPILSVNLGPDFRESLLMELGGHEIFRRDAF